MSIHQTFLQRIVQRGLLLLLLMGGCVNANAGWFGFGGDSWKEEVLLHDGSKIIVKRSQTYGGRHEIGQPQPIKEHFIEFALPNSNKTIEWKSEYGDDIGRTNFNLLAVHVLNNTPYVVTSPNLCLSYNKWGRPNPPYVFFKYDGQEWQRVPLGEFPVEFKTINVALDIRGRDVESLVRKGFVSVESIKERNAHSTIPEFRTILREPLAKGPDCGEMAGNGKGKWVGMGWFRDQPTYETCVSYCQREDFDAQHCPCSTMFKGAK